MKTLYIRMNTTLNRVKKVRVKPIFTRTTTHSAFSNPYDYIRITTHHCIRVRRINDRVTSIRLRTCFSRVTQNYVTGRLRCPNTRVNVSNSCQDVYLPRDSRLFNRVRWTWEFNPFQYVYLPRDTRFIVPRYSERSDYDCITVVL